MVLETQTLPNHNSRFGTYCKISELDYEVIKGIN